MITENFFTLQDLLLLPDDPTAEYISSSKNLEVDKFTPKWGQMKLFLSELWFFSQFGEPTVNKGAIVIYVGAAEGIHIPILVQLLPWISEWHLYDPRDFAFNQPSKNNSEKPDWAERIFIHTKEEGYFTNNKAQEWVIKLRNQRKSAFFISDIRNLEMALLDNSREKDDQEYVKGNIANNDILVKDMTIQAEWYLILKSILIKASLKFRLPYPVTDKEWLKAGKANIVNPYLPNGYFTYLYGYIMKQPYSSRNSSETRLIPLDNEKGQPRFYDWNYSFYDNQMFYFKRFVRNNKIFRWPGTEFIEILVNQFPNYGSYNQTFADQEPGLSWDLSAVIYIYLIYLAVHGIDQLECIKPLHSAVMANLNVAGLDYPNMEQVYQVALQNYINWQNNGQIVIQKTFQSKLAHARTSTTWDITYGQSSTYPIAMKLTPQDISAATQFKIG